MRNIRIYTNQPLASGQEAKLDTQASRHLVSVLRMTAGNPATLFNGSGGEFQATLLTADSKSCIVSVGDFRDKESESPLCIHLGIGISRGDRMDWVVQKATELGVSRITPLYTERTEVRLKGDREAKKLRHWQQISISACEQCGRNRLPEIDPPQLLSSWLAAAEGDRKFILHHRAEVMPDATAGKPGRVVLLVGPEGGFSESEVLRAGDARFRGMKLGPRVLRTETAPLAAISILQARWGDMG